MEQRHGNPSGPEALTPVCARLRFEPDGTAQAANLTAPASDIYVSGGSASVATTSA